MNAEQTAASRGTGRVDQNALRFNQASLVSLTLLAFVLGTGNGGAWIVLAVGLSMAIGVVFQGKGPFQLLYRRAVLPVGILEPHPLVESPKPHRFAQAMGATCLLVSSALLFAGFEVAGWAIAWLVVVLALVNLIFGFCAGCFIFLQIERLRHREAIAR